MTRVTPRSEAELEAMPEFEEALALQRSLVGLVPISLLTMAHRPRMAILFASLASEVLAPGSVDQPLKQLVAYVASATRGCRYCQAHTAQNAARVGLPLAKLQSAFEFETSGLFTEAESDALRLARDAAVLPNAVTDVHFARLQRWFTHEQIVEIVGVVALFGWLNTWNDTMATTLEDLPRHWAQQNIASSGWSVGRHVHSPAEDAIAGLAPTTPNK